MTISICIITLTIVISFFLLNIISIIKSVYYSKYIDDKFNVYNYIDTLISEWVYMYISNNFKGEKIDDNMISKIYNDIIINYVSCISYKVLKKISLYIKDDRIYFIISERLSIIIPTIIKEYNTNLERR